VITPEDDPMTRWLFAGTAALALVAAGLVHGYWTDRWSTSADTQDAARRLQDVPLVIGDWEGEEIEVRPGQAGPGVTGCIQRRYFNRHLRATVVLALVNGRPGPVGTHTPEACYGASGYVVARRTEVKVPLDTEGGSAQFWTSDAVRTNVSEETKLRLFWAWNAGQGWVAAKDARGEFPRSRYPVLHKLYVLRDISGTADRGKAGTREEPCVVFLEALLPVLDRVLFGSDA
jgi:hypothetical protein